MRGDEAELYRTLSPHVLRTVRSQVQTSSENIEDACHFAWLAFLRRSDDVERATARSWVTTTAIHEAYKLIKKQQRTASLDQVLESGLEPADTTPTAKPTRRAERREQIDLVQQLPDRQRRIVLLQAAGLSHAEIAHATGDTERTVQRQLYRARHSLAQLARTDSSPQRRLGIPPLSIRDQSAPVRKL
jgi:RNA polymerase sigma factor (sigma-70 family)